MDNLDPDFRDLESLIYQNDQEIQKELEQHDPDTLLAKRFDDLAKGMRLLKDDHKLFIKEWEMTKNAR